MRNKLVRIMAPKERLSENVSIYQDDERHLSFLPPF
jgi:hypothetical protein